MTLIGYILGVLAHVAFKWSSWKATSKEGWMAYWRSHGALNIASGIAAIVCYGLWESGWITAFLERAYVIAVSSFTQADVQVASLPMTFWTSVAAGYMLDSAARHLLGRVSSLAGGDQTS